MALKEMGIPYGSHISFYGKALQSSDGGPSGKMLLCSHRRAKLKPYAQGLPLLRNKWL